MGERFISYEAHGVVETSLVKSTKIGHHYNCEAEVDVDNGSVCVIGEFLREDVWKADIPKVGSKVVLVNAPVKIYSDYTKRMQEESNFFNEKNKPFRCFEIQDTDRFTLSKEAFSDAANPEVGEYVGVDGVGYKLNTLGKVDPGATYGFLGKIYAIANNGNYRIWVIRNVQL